MSKLFCALEKRVIGYDKWETLKNDISFNFPDSFRNFLVGPFRPYRITKMIDTWKDNQVPTNLSEGVLEVFDKRSKQFRGYLYLDEVKVLIKALRDNYPFSKLPSLKWSEEAIKQLKEALEVLEYIIAYPQVLIDFNMEYYSPTTSSDLRDYRIFFWLN